MSPDKKMLVGFDTYHSHSFFYNSRPIGEFQNLFNVNLDTNTIELSSSFSSSAFSGSSNNFSSWNQIRTGDNIIARKMRENNIISLEKVSRDSIIKTAKGERISKREKRGDVESFIEPIVSNKHKPVKFRFIFKGNTNPFLAHEVIFSHANNLVTFSNKELVRKLGLNKNKDQFYDRLREFYLDPNKKEEDNPIAKVLGFSIEEVIFPKEQNTGLAETRGRTKYILDKPGFDKDGFDRQFRNSKSILARPS